MNSILKVFLNNEKNIERKQLFILRQLFGIRKELFSKNSQLRNFTIFFLMKPFKLVFFFTTAFTYI